MDGSPGASESTDPERAGQVPAVPAHQQAATKGSQASGGAEVSSISLGHDCVQGWLQQRGHPSWSLGPSSAHSFPV